VTPARFTQPDHPTTHQEHLMLSTDQWSTIHRLVSWLDRENGRSQEEIALRILKLSEEQGEGAQAWIGYKGQNPRKGRTRTLDQVAEELVDVIVTAAVALTSITDKPDRFLDAKLEKIAARVNV
jgi:NTP pyrophosphatase (non-canonical NTP hydrolase)